MPQMNARIIHLRIFVIIYLIVAVLLTHHTQAQQNGDIRLINNTILEAYLRGSWGAVCDDFWSLANTHVACRELGFRRGLAYQQGISSDTGIFHLDDVVCLGNESSITECRCSLNDDCSPHEHVLITCETHGCESFAPFADSVAITVQYYAQVQWYCISSEDFTNENAEVICRENTNSGFESYTYQSREATSSTLIYQYHFTCAGNESSLCECEKSPASITSDLIVKIKCQSSEGKLRLVSGVNEHSGYVLINHKDTWKAICVSEEDSNFQLAYVACIQLGYKGVYNYYYDTSLENIVIGGNYFHTHSRQMDSWLTKPQCTGNEKSVTQCNGTLKDSVCKAIPLWVNCEVHQLHDVELRSTTGSQYEGETYILYDNKRSNLCLPDGIFDSTLGNAICRTIGAPSYQNWSSIVSDDAEFLNLQYTCFGNEDNLASCFSSVLDHRRCKILYLICNPSADETPRISYGSTEVGLVDIYARQKWGLSCMSNSGRLEASDAQVICKQLGLSGNGLQLFDYPITQPQNYWNSVFNCLGTESSLAEGNCLLTTGYNSQCPTSTNVAAKIICRPSKSQLRLSRSTIDIHFFRVEYLTPERTWAPVCDIPPAPCVEICKKFGFSAPDITRSVVTNVHTFAQLECLSSDIDTCDVNFKYDYNSYYGCVRILEVSCTNQTEPKIKPENMRAHVLSSTSVLLIWDYIYEITESNMFYRYELTTIDGNNYNPDVFGVSDWGGDHSRTSRRYKIFNGLTPYSTYSFKLRLINDAGFGPYGNAMGFTTHEATPTGIPINVAIHSIGESEFTIQWEGLTTYEHHDVMLGYQVCVRLSSSDDVCNSANTESYTPETTTPFQLQRTGLLPYTEYTVVIRAYNFKGYGPYSPSVSTTTDALSPEITHPVSDQIIRITSISKLESFSLNQRCVSTGFPVPTVRWTSNTNVNPSDTVLSLRTEDLDLDVINAFTCMATNIGGSHSKTVRIFIQIQLGTPVAPIADTVDATSIRIHWVEYASVVYNISYTVCVRKSVATSCTQTVHTTRNAVAVSNLEESTTYSISVTINTIFGTSPRSLSLNITTDDPEPVRPKINTPRQDISINITSVVSFESFSLTQNCIGIPTPTITWTSNTNSSLNVISDTLTLRSHDLNPEISNNIFTCTATNTAGQDSRNISVTIDIQLTAPQQPTQQSIGINSVDIEWVEYISSVYVKSYEICVRSTTDTECIQTINTVSTQYSIGRLEPATTYRISMVAITVFGRSPASRPLTITTNEAESVLPNITTPQQNTTIMISRVNEFQSFSLVLNCVSTGIPTPTITWTSNTGRIFVVGSVLSVGVSHLRRSTDVDVFLCIAMNTVGRDIRQIRVEKSIELPTAKTPTVHNVSVNSITIRWPQYDLVSYVSYYEICVGIPGESGCIQRNRTNSRQYTIASLQASSQYSITIVAYTDFGTSPRSDSLPATTDSDKQCLILDETS